MEWTREHPERFTASLSHHQTPLSRLASFNLFPSASFSSPHCIYFLLDFSTHAPSYPLYLTLSIFFSSHNSHTLIITIHTLFLLLLLLLLLLLSLFHSFFQHGWHQPRRNKKRERRSGTFSASSLFLLNFLLYAL